MAKMPSGVDLIYNPLTVAPGFKIENVFVLPGVPQIMQKMFLQILENLKKGSPKKILTINTNLYESTIALFLNNIQKKYSKCSIGSYPYFNYIEKKGGVNIVVSSWTMESLDGVVLEIQNMIRLKGGKSFIEEYRRRLNKKADGGRIEFKKGGNITVKNEKDSKKAFQIAIEKGLKNPEDHMYMYTKDGKDFFKHIGTRKYDSFKKGGKADKKWIQKATKGMRKDKPCTGKKFGSATCPPGSKRYNLAKTFKKMARSKHASGGLVRYI